jgi:hypothetical protein
MQLIVFRSLPLLFIILISYHCFGQTAKQEADSPVKFEVSSVRLLSEEELARKTGDNIVESGFALKCRVSNQGRQTVYLHTDFANTIIPTGHLVRKTGKGLLWVLDASGKTSTESPGLKPPYLLSSGTWLTLSEGDAVEWEVIQETASTEETHAMTVFMRFGKSEKVVEVFSNFYKVPAKKSK